MSGFSSVHLGNKDRSGVICSKKRPWTVVTGMLEFVTCEDCLRVIKESKETKV